MFPGAFKMPPDISWRVRRVQLMERYHLTFEQIDTMSLEDLGDILGYESEEARIKEAQSNKNKRLGG